MHSDRSLPFLRASSKMENYQIVPANQIVPAGSTPPHHQDGAQYGHAYAALQRIINSAAEAAATLAVQQYAEAISRSAGRSVSAFSIEDANEEAKTQRTTLPNVLNDDPLPEQELLFNIKKAGSIYCYNHAEEHEDKRKRNGEHVKPPTVAALFHPAYCKSCRSDTTQSVGWAFLTATENDLINLCRRHLITAETLKDVKHTIAVAQHNSAAQRFEEMHLADREMEIVHIGDLYGAHREAISEDDSSSDTRSFTSADYAQL